MGKKQKQKQKYVKVDLRKEKVTKSSNGGIVSTIDKGVWASNRDKYLKKVEKQQEDKKEEKPHKEKFFASDAGVDTKTLEKGVIVGADFSKEDYGDVKIIQVLEDNSVQVKVKHIPASVLKTTGIGAWNGKTYQAFYPYQSDVTGILGEGVRMESKESVVLNVSSLALRVETLCEVISLCDSEQAQEIKDTLCTMITKYVLSVVDGKKLDKRDKEYVLEKMQELFNVDTEYFAKDFKELKHLMQLKVQENARMKRYQNGGRQNGKQGGRKFYYEDREYN